MSQLPDRPDRSRRPDRPDRTGAGGDAWWPFEGTREEQLRSALDGRVSADPEDVEKGLVQLVLTLVELLRELMERQAIRRVDAGGLDEEEIERLGRTLMLLEQRMDELREHFGLTREDLNIDLGPLGRLL